LIYNDIDFSRGYEVKSNQLYKLLKDQNIGKRYTDELIKVYLKDGTEKWLLIHSEVQNYKEKDFAKRMYIYNYRIFDKYDHEVVSLVILTDPDKTFRPDTYIHRRWSFNFITSKLRRQVDGGNNKIRKGAENDICHPYGKNC
jgi:hypothetical protein